MRLNERFHFVFAADFPNCYDRRAIEALQNVGNTGPVAGTYVFIHHNRNHELPGDMGMGGFKNAFHVDLDGNGAPARLTLSSAFDGPPAADLQSLVFQKLSSAKPPERILDWDGLVGLPEEEWWARAARGSSSVR